jgi:DnaK suppressor protein
MSTAITPTVSTDWTPFQELLETAKAEALRDRDLALAETATSLPDPVAVSRAGTLSRTLEEIDEALQRISAGTYGVCVQCGAAIPVERLEFRPFAARCVACEQKSH